MEYGVCTDRSGYRISFRLQLLDSRYDFPDLLVADAVTCVVQVQGKVRAKLEVAPDISEDELQALALADENVQRSLDGREVRKVIVRAPKLVSIVPA